MSLRRRAATVTVPPAGENLTALSSEVREDLAELVAIGLRGERPSGTSTTKLWPFAVALASWLSTRVRDDGSRTSVGASWTCRSPVSSRATLRSASTICVRRSDSEAM